MAATNYKYVVLGGGQAAGYIAREVGPDILLKSVSLRSITCMRHEQHFRCNHYMANYHRVTSRLADRAVAILQMLAAII
jgi:hypothetical protein